MWPSLVGFASSSFVHLHEPQSCNRIATRQLHSPQEVIQQVIQMASDINATLPGSPVSDPTSDAQHDPSSVKAQSPDSFTFEVIDPYHYGTAFKQLPGAIYRYRLSTEEQEALAKIFPDSFVAGEVKEGLSEKTKAWVESILGKNAFEESLDPTATVTTEWSVRHIPLLAALLLNRFDFVLTATTLIACASSKKAKKQSKTLSLLLKFCTDPTAVKLAGQIYWSTTEKMRGGRLDESGVWCTEPQLNVDSVSPTALSARQMAFSSLLKLVYPDLGNIGVNFLRNRAGL